MPQVLPFEQLHRVVGAELVDAVVERADDARVPEARENVVLALESLNELLLRPRPREQALERARLARRAIEHAIHDAHPARGQLLLHDVAGCRPRDGTVSPGLSP